jgi:hypothetical protein
MINLEFNYTCPFCSSKLSESVNFYLKCRTFTCQNCIQINNIYNIDFLYPYETNVLMAISIEKIMNMKRFGFSLHNNTIKIYPARNASFPTFRIEQLSDHIPEFNSIQDLLEIASTLILFK